MTSTSRSAKNHPDSFCYICGEFKITDERNRITEFIQKAYHAYFGIQFGDQDKPWAPHVVCKTCVEHLRQRTQGSRKVWHSNDLEGAKKPYQRLLLLCYQFDRN